MKRQQRIPQGSIRTRSTSYPRRIHEEAFDLSGGLSGILTGQTGLYCAGLSCPQVGEALRERYGADAPHDNTLKRWMVRDRWASRRQAIREHTARLDDRCHLDALWTSPENG